MRQRTKAPALVALVAAAGCGGLLDVELPGSTPEEALDDPAYASLMVTSAQSEFECAFSNYAFLSGLIAGELVGGDTDGNMQQYQRRDVRQGDNDFGRNACSSSNGLYTPLSIARFVSDDAFKRLSAYTDAQVANRNRLLGRAALYSGFSYAVFAESFCRAAFDLGPAVTPPQVFQLAKDKFTKAIELAGPASDAETLNAAYVGRARVEMALGETAAAVADARRVPAGYRKDVTRSNASTTRQNDIQLQTVRRRAQAVDPAFWNTTWMGVADPRVAVTNTGAKALNGLTPLWLQQKYATEASPIRLASYTEAQLIIAEVEGGQTAVTIINALHTAAGIPPFTSTDAAAIRRQVIEERRREFFLEGRRMGDLRRFGGFQDAAGGKHPFVGYAYGGMECFPLPEVELLNNPNIK